MGLRVPVEMEDLASDKRASIAAHSIALIFHDSITSNTAPDYDALTQWHERWHHAVMRIHDSGPDALTDAGVVVTTKPN